MANFKDYFSKQSDLYLQYRPQYPRALYAYLASLTNQHTLAWDCGTGNGQAAVGLAEFYDGVVASDPSEAQIKNAIQHPNIQYVVEKSEHTSLTDHSIDLVTVANALHWFNFDLFYKEINRVVKKQGIIAAWAYGLPFINEEIDAIIQHYHYDTLGSYWLAENKLVEEGYINVPFPLNELPAPEFIYEKEMDLPGVIGYLNTWSATQRYIDQHGVNPTEGLAEALAQAWGNKSNTQKVNWKLILKIGRV